MMEIAVVALALGLALAGTAWQMKGHVPWWSYLLTAGAWLVLACHNAWMERPWWAILQALLAGFMAATGIEKIPVKTEANR